VTALSLLSRSSLAEDAVPLIPGTWDWPDQGLTLQQDGDEMQGAHVFDLLPYDGRLVVAGSFLYAGGVDARRLAVWDGASWERLGDGSPSSLVRTLLTSESELYIGGHFLSVAGVAARKVAKWDGFTWSGFGTGLSWTAVYDLELWDDGSGSTSLFAAGNSIAKWNGETWSVVGGGISGGGGGARALSLYDDGTGAALYMGGFFAAAGGVPANRIAKWDGTKWSAVGGGITQGSHVYALAVYDDGTGDKLYAGGLFNAMGGVPAINLACWDGESWSAVGNPGWQSFNEVYQLRVLDDDGDGPNPPALFAIGADVLHKWDGKSWARYPIPGATFTANVYDGPEGPTLHVAGGIWFEGDPDRHTNIVRFTRGHACGDLNGDGMVDQEDLGILLAAFNCPGPGCQGDADGDGDTDQADLGILLANFGQKCG